MVAAVLTGAWFAPCLLLLVLFLQGSAIAGPGGLDPSGARQRQALVPVPERTWALRNVANNMLRSAVSGDGSSNGAAAVSEALAMFKQAAELSANHYGPHSPGAAAASRL